VVRVDRHAEAAGLFWAEHLFTEAPLFPKAEVLRFLGKGRVGQASRKTSRRVNTWIRSLSHLIKPRLIYSIGKVADVTRTAVCLRNGAVIKSSKIAKSLQDCRTVVCFAATLGKEIDHQIEQLNGENRIVDAFIVDALGSVAAEQLVKSFHVQMEQDCIEQGKGVTLRFSPGYCDWPLTAQDLLFKLLPAQKIGLRLTESFMMMPRKSVTGVFGVTRTPASMARSHNPCLICQKLDCTVRRAGATSI